VVPVIALAICDRLPKVWPFQANPSSKIMTRSSLPFHSRTNRAPAFRPKDLSDRFVEIAERVGLEPIAQHPHQKPAWKMGRRFAAQMGAPLTA
jgi:hypothetical protein